LYVVFASYDTWMTDTDIDADVEPPLEPDGPYQVRASNFLLYSFSYLTDTRAHLHTCDFNNHLQPCR